MFLQDGCGEDAFFLVTTSESERNLTCSLIILTSVDFYVFLSGEICV